MKLKIKKFKLVNNIGSILQVTKNIIQQNENYHDYLINKNNNLYLKQLPLLMRSRRLDSILSPRNDHKKLNNSKDNNSTMEEEEEKQIIQKKSSMRSLFSLYQIRNISIKSKKLPPLCPLYNEQGELVRSMIDSTKIRHKIIFEDEKSICNNISFSSSRNNNDILRKNYNKFGFSSLLSKIDKDIKNRSNIDLNLYMDYENYEFENFFSTDEEYSNLKYDESEIFGKNNRKHHENIIKQKIIELQFSENKNYTEKKEKIFEYAHKKKEIKLTLDSLIIKITEIIDEEKFILNDIPNFIYELPLALLPLFYYKGPEKFLMILSKIITYNNINDKFELIKNDDEMISYILKNCEDFESTKNSNFDEINEINGEDPTFDNIKQEKKNAKVSIRIKSPRKKRRYAEMFGRKSNGNFCISSNIISNNNFGKFHADVYSKKNNNSNFLLYNSFEYYWITPNKKFQIFINMPLITINIPRNNIIAKKYIEFDLLFYLYEKQFLCWDFYVLKYLYSFKSFRILLKQLNSIPEIYSRNFFITQPKQRCYGFNENILIAIISSKQKNIINNNHQNNSDEKNNINNCNNLNDSNQENQIISNEKIDYMNSTMILKSLKAIVSFVNENKGHTNEYVFHFNFEQTRKFQTMEKYIDTIRLLIKFLNINYENETISFDFDSFNTFNVTNWILELKKYNNKYIKKIPSLSDLNNDNNQKQKNKNKYSAEYENTIRGITIKIEIKNPIVLYKTISDIGGVNTKCINIDKKIEEMLGNDNKNVLALAKIIMEKYENKKNEEDSILNARKTMNKKFKKQTTMVNIKDNGFFFDKLMYKKKPSLFEFVKKE